MSLLFTKKEERKNVMRFIGYTGIGICLLGGLVPAWAAPLGTAFTYQGRLKQSGSPLNTTADFQFTLWDDPAAGNQLGSAVVVSNVAVSSGLFTVPLNASNEFGAGAFNGDARWLEIAVRSPAGGGAFTTLSPRQALTATPQALFAVNNWGLAGNAGTNPATQFVGTTDNQPLVLKVNNRRVMQYQYAVGGGFNIYRGINTLGGAEINSIGVGVVGATIAGGGGWFNDSPNPNAVSGDFGTVGGGFGNTAGYYATVAGGFANTASGSYSTVAGGFYTTASGDYSFAAGNQAKANHAGAFVWADSTLAEFASTGNNQFLIRASGGVGIGTPAPLNALHIVHGTVGTGGTTNWGVRIENSLQATYRCGMRMADDGWFDITSRIGGAGFARLNSAGAWSAVSDRRLKTDIQPLGGLLDKALALQPVSYYFKQQDMTQVPHRQLGFIAQDVEPVLPSLVSGGDTRTLNYAGLSVVAIGAVQELKREKDAEIASLRAEVKQLRSELAAMKSLSARLDALEASMAVKANDNSTAVVRAGGAR